MSGPTRLEDAVAEMNILNHRFMYFHRCRERLRQRDLRVTARSTEALATAGPDSSQVATITRRASVERLIDFPGPPPPPASHFSQGAGIAQGGEVAAA